MEITEVFWIMTVRHDAKGFFEEVTLRNIATVPLPYDSMTLFDEVLREVRQQVGDPKNCAVTFYSFSPKTML